MNIGRILAYACDGGIYCVDCMSSEPARYSACDADGATFDGSAGWHSCCKTDKGSPCHVVPTDPQSEPCAIHSGELEEAETCTGCGAYYDGEWGNFVSPDSELGPDPAPDINRIIAYEQGKLDAQETVILFSQLISSGFIASLQGAYGRMAAQLIESGALDASGAILIDASEGS